MSGRDNLKDKEDHDEEIDDICPIVGVGASAGGLADFTRFLESLKAETGMAFIFIQHLSPDKKSQLTAILSRKTAMPVYEIEDSVKVEPNHVYISPPGSYLTLEKGMLRLKPFREDQHPKTIDTFFQSLAEELKSRALGVLLSGTGSDGTSGFKAIKAQGGVTFALVDKKSRFPEMASTAILSGVVDYPLGIKELVKTVSTIGSSLTQSLTDLGELIEPEPLDHIYSILHSRYGVDFNRYKWSTIHRRLNKRMMLKQTDSLDSYLDILRSSPDEVHSLYHDLLIHVTEFFREPESYKTLREVVFPPLIEERNSRDPIRVWVPGCSTGEEAYSIAIVLSELLFDRQINFPIQIFATDVNEESIAFARRGKYSVGIEENVSTERLNKYFERETDGYQISKGIRDTCVFAHHDILSDPPFSHIDFASCRNLLIYLKPEAQESALRSLHFSLKPNGFLMLGKSESLGKSTNLFSGDQGRGMIFIKKNVAIPVLPAYVSTYIPKIGIPPHVVPIRETEGIDFLKNKIQLMILNEYAPPGVVVNDEYEVKHFVGKTGDYLEPSSGVPSFNLLNMMSTTLSFKLRVALEKAKKENIIVRDYVLSLEKGDNRRINFEITPLNLSTFGEQFYFIVFDSAEESYEIAESDDSASEQKPVKDDSISRLKKELEDTRKYLAGSLQDQDVINEELRSANEELQASYEELQSSNEELESAKEELQATNEELNTINAEQSVRNQELQTLSDDRMNLLANTNIPIIFVTDDLIIRQTTDITYEKMNILPTDVGRSIADLKLNINVEGLKDAINNVLADFTPVRLEAEGDNESWFVIEIRPYITKGRLISGAIIMFHDITERKRAERVVETALDFAESIVETVREPLIILDTDLRVISANHSFYTTFHVSPEETESRLIYDLGNSQWDIPELRRLLEEVLPQNTSFNDYLIEHEFPRIGRRVMLLNARSLYRETNETERILLAIEDITERKSLEEQVSVAFNALERRVSVAYDALNSTIDGVIITDLEGIIRYVNSSFSAMFGYGSPEEARGIRAVELFLSEEKRKFADVLTIIDRVEGDTEEFKATRKDGTVFDVEVSTSLVTDHEGNDWGRMASFRDITERKRLEEELGKSERMAAIGRLASTVGHELRNPLGVIKNSAYYLSLRLEDVSDEKVARHIHLIDQEVNRSNTVISDLLEFAREPRPPSLENVDLNRLVEETIQRVDTPETVELELTIGELPEFQADSGMILRVLLNIVTNAVDAMPNGGILTVETRLNDENVEVSVTDTGVGITTENMERLFTPLFTTKTKGVGLGLYTTKTLVEAHGGSIEVHSRVDEGSTFTVKLPTSREEL